MLRCFFGVSSSACTLEDEEGWMIIDVFKDLCSRLSLQAGCGCLHWAAWWRPKLGAQFLSLAPGCVWLLGAGPEAISPRRVGPTNSQPLQLEWAAQQVQTCWIISSSLSSENTVCTFFFCQSCINLIYILFFAVRILCEIPLAIALWQNVSPAYQWIEKSSILDFFCLHHLS